MSPDERSMRVVRNSESGRYEIYLGEDRVGYAAYREEPGRVVFTHTVIDPAYEGRGLGSRLAGFALDDVRSRGLLIVAQCPFIAAYVKRHPEYADLVASGS
jgi:predicted GNAT family acetyltransferase